MTDILDCGVIGAGVFGGYHAAQYARLPGARLAAVFDPDLSRAEALAQAHGAQAFDDLETFLAIVGAVSIASPAQFHADQAVAALTAGAHVYVEKPVAASLRDADRVQSLAQARKRVAAAGHQERVVFREMGLLDAPETPLLIEAVRLGTPSERNRDVSVVLDLMIHDLDLALALALGDAVTAEGEGALAPDGVLDDVRAELTFEKGAIARFTASRMAERRERTMRVVYPSGEVEVDFIARTFRNSTDFALNADFADAPAARDPLGASLAAFLSAARGETPRPIATVGEAMAALDAALAVEQAVEGGGW